MSDAMTGADLQHLDELSVAYETAGAQIAAKAADLRSRIDAAVEAFMTSMDTLSTNAATLTDSIDTEISQVGSFAGSVQWTGSNRGAFDGDLATFTSAVNTGMAKIKSDISTLKTQVDTRFTPVLTEFGAALGLSADEANTTAIGMKGAVATQRSNLDQAANVGWLSA